MSWYQCTPNSFYFHDFFHSFWRFVERGCLGMSGTLFVLALRLFIAKPETFLTTIPHPSQARLDLEALADLKLPSPGSHCDCILSPLHQHGN